MRQYLALAALAICLVIQTYLVLTQQRQIRELLTMIDEATTMLNRQTAIIKSNCGQAI